MDQSSKPPELELVSLSETKRCVLKWFNAPKGFGFVKEESDDQSKVKDIFFHITTLQKYGLCSIGEGAIMDCVIIRGEKGDYIEKIIDIIDHGKLPDNHDAPPAIEDHSTIGTKEKCKGTIKWYNTEKGYGFVTPDDMDSDLFIHRSCLEKCGITQLQEGQRVKVTYRNVLKGREVIFLDLIEQN